MEIEAYSWLLLLDNSQDLRMGSITELPAPMPSLTLSASAVTFASV